VKEESEEPPLVVPRAPLPPGAMNYVTQRGLAALRRERALLEGARPERDGPGGATALAARQARLSALNERIASAVTIEPAALPHDEVRFSALVTLQNHAGEQRRYRIVGVDEADAPSGRIAFTAPLARELAGKQVGDAIVLRDPRGTNEFEVTSIDYSQDD